MKLSTTHGSFAARSRKFLLLASAATLLAAIAASAQPTRGPDLSVVNACAVNGPQSVLCTVTVTNIGGVPSVAPLTLVDTPSAPAGSTYTGGGGSLPISCALGAGPVLPISCTANKSLQPGESGTALFSFTVPKGGRFGNCVTVSASQNAATLPDPNPTNNTNICTSINVPSTSGGGGDPGGGGPITVVTPPPSGECSNSVVVSGMHYPNLSCAQSTPNFLAGMMSSFHLKSKCPAGTQLLGVINASCQNAPIPGFANGSVYQATACCGRVAPPAGRIIIRKVVENKTSFPTPGPFEVQVKCTPEIDVSSVSLSAPGFDHTLNVPAGTKCKIEEVSPKAPAGCRWVTSYPNGQSGGVGTTLLVRNELLCQSCPEGQNETSFPGSDVKYCCEGRPGNDKFCCNRKK